MDNLKGGMEFDQATYLVAVTKSHYFGIIHLPLSSNTQFSRFMVASSAGNSFEIRQIVSLPYKNHWTIKCGIIGRLSAKSSS